MDIPKVVQSYFNPCKQWSKAENKAQCFLVIAQVASYFFIIIPLFVATMGLGAWSFSKLFKETPASSSSNTENKKPEIHSDPQVAFRDAQDNFNALETFFDSNDSSPATSGPLFALKSLCYFYVGYKGMLISDAEDTLKACRTQIVGGQKVPKEDRVLWLLPILYTCTHKGFSNSTQNTLKEIAKLLPPLKKSSSVEDINLYISLLEILNQHNFSDFNYMGMPEVFEIIKEIIQKVDLGKNKNKALCETLNADISKLKVNMPIYLEQAREKFVNEG